MHTLSSDMKTCTEACRRCHGTCLQSAMHHCLETGGQYVEAKHFRLMTTSAEICRTSAALMLIGQRSHLLHCELCAKVCEDCAADCERIGGMGDCVAACRACAKQCRRGGQPGPGRPGAAA